MTIKPNTGPCLLMAAGAILLAAGLVGMQPPMILFGAVLLGLGFWSLRGLDMSRFLQGPMLLLASSAALAVAGIIGGHVILIVMALAAAGLACYAWLRVQG